MIDSSKWARMLSENNLSRKENFKKKILGRGRFNSRGTNQRQNPSKDIYVGIPVILLTFLWTTREFEITKSPTRLLLDRV